MVKTTIGAQELPKLDELLRLPGAPAAAAVSKSGKAAGKAALRKRLDDEELIAPEAAFTAGENPPDQSVATDEIPPQPLEAAAEEEVAAEDGGSAEDAYSSVEADAWSAEWTTATESEDRILLAQAGGGGTGGGDEGGLGGNDFMIPLAVGGALVLLSGGDDEGGGGGGGAASSFADINAELGATLPETVIGPTTGTAHNFFIGSIAGLSAEEGFSRDLLPATLAALDAQMVYDFRFSNATSGTGTIDHTGLQVNMAALDTTNINVYVSASASGTESHLIWLGNVGVAATAAAADAFVSAQANASAGGDAEVGISNFNVALAGTGTVTAGASLNATATGPGSMAGAFIGNDMRVSATAEAAAAAIGVIGASASSSSTAEVSIGGDVSVSAMGQTYAVAAIGYIGAIASYSSTAEVSIGGDVVVNASADGISGSAYAYVGGITADASNSSYALVDIGGDVSVSAIGQTYAVAALSGISAEADGYSTAEVNIAGAGGVNVYAHAASGSAYASMDDISADASTSSIARVDIGGDVSVRAFGQNYASAVMGSISADASESYSTAEVVIAGGVDVYAYAATGSAFAELDEVISADAATGSIARVDIGGDVSVRAFGQNYASAEMSSISASADRASTAEINIAGGVDVYAYAWSGAAYADMSSISADASTSSIARVDIGGDVSVRAFGQTYAAAEMDDISASAEGATDSGAVIPGAGSTAEVDIAGGVNVYAYAWSGTAYASMGSISANASYSSIARVDIGGDVTVGAVGEDRAMAYVGYVSASAANGYSADSQSVANVTIGGLNVYATAGTGTANAYVDGIVAFASDDAQATITIGPAGATAGEDAVSVHADGQDGASAFIPIHAYASGEDSTAQIVINGNVRVSASASTFSADAYAVLFVGAGVTYRSSAFDTGGGRVEINGNVYLSASLDGFGSPSGAAHAYGQLIAAGTGSVYVAGSVNIAVDESGDAWLDIYASNDNGIDLGNINVDVDFATADVYIQQSVSSSMMPDDFFLPHGSSTANIGIGNLNVDVFGGGQANFFIGGGTSASSSDDGIDWDLARTADLSGTGDVYMRLHDQVFGTIDVVDLVGNLALEYDLGDHDFATVGTEPGDAHITTIVGFSETGTNIMFNNTNATTANFAMIGGTAGFLTFTAMTAAISLALDGTDKYVFAVYRGVEDINSNGLSDDQDSGILAYDKDGIDITAVLMLPGVTVLNPSDIAFTV